MVFKQVIALFSVGFNLESLGQNVLATLVELPAVDEASLILADLTAGFGHVIGLLVSESTPQTHGASNVQRAQLHAANVVIGIATESDGASAFDLDDVTFAADGDLLDFSRQSGCLAVDQDLVALDFNLVGTDSKDDGLLVGSLVFDVESDSKVFIEEVTSEQVLAIAIHIDSLVVKGDDSSGSNQNSVSYFKNNNMINIHESISRNGRNF